jgi:hypothetical protein
MENSVTLSCEQVRERFKALDGIGNLVQNLVSKPGNAWQLFNVNPGIAGSSPAYGATS